MHSDGPVAPSALPGGTASGPAEPVPRRPPVGRVGSPWGLVPWPRWRCWSRPGCGRCAPEAGAAWALARVPGLTAEGVSGALLGDLQVQRLAIHLAARRSVTIAGARWQACASRLRKADGRACRSTGSPPSAMQVTPSAPADPLHAGAGLAGLAARTGHRFGRGRHPGHQLARRDAAAAVARPHSPGRGGRRCSTASTASRWPGAAARRGQRRDRHGSAAAGRGFAGADARRRARQRAVVGARHADGRARAAAPAGHAARRAGQRPGAPAAAGADTRSRRDLRPFERWPLGDLQAKAKGLDLSAFHRDAPATAISGEAIAKTHAADQPRRRQYATLDNAAPGLWNDGKLPLRRLTLALRTARRSIDARAARARRRARHDQAAGRAHHRARPLVTRGLEPGRHARRAAARPARRARAGHTPGRPAHAGRQPAHRGGAAHRGARRTGGRGARPRRRPPGEGEARRAVATRERRRPARTAQRRGQRRRHAACLAGRATRGAPDAAWQLQGRATLAEFDPSLWWRGRGFTLAARPAPAQRQRRVRPEPAAQRQRRRAARPPRGAAAAARSRSPTAGSPACRFAQPHRAAGRRQRAAHDGAPSSTATRWMRKAASLPRTTAPTTAGR